MFKQSQKVAGDWGYALRGKFWNRTGGTLLKGQIAMIDLSSSATESTSIDPNAPTSGVDGTIAQGNVVTATQALLDQGAMLVVCLETSVGDNQVGEFCIEGPCEVAVTDDDVATTDVDKGDGLQMIVATEPNAVEAAITGKRILGIALEDAAAATDSSATEINATSHRRKVIWTGGRPCSGINL